MSPSDAASVVAGFIAFCAAAGLVALWAMSWGVAKLSELMDDPEDLPPHWEDGL